MSDESDREDDVDDVKDVLQRITVPPETHPASPDELNVFYDMLKPDASSRVWLGLSHTLMENNTVDCFRFECSAKRMCAGLPITSNFFHNTVIVECQEQQGGNDRSNSNVLRMLMQGDQVLNKLKTFINKIQKSSCTGKVASFDCAADELDLEVEGTMIGALNTKSLQDAYEWTTEIPQHIGVYHTFNKGFGDSYRKHKLFLAVSGGCVRMNKTYENMVQRVSQNMTCGEICDSAETWFCRSMNQRHNCALLYDLSKHLSLDVSTSTDTYSYNHRLVAVPDSQTMHSDIFRDKNNRITILNGCVDTRRSRNGIIHYINPNDGIVLLKGLRGSNMLMHPYGNAFGSVSEAHAFPISCRKQKTFPRDENSYISYLPAPFVSHIDDLGNLLDNSQVTCKYSALDEKYYRGLNAMGWSRGNGYLELIPIASIYKS